MVDVVGLRFVTQGEAQALKALDSYRKGLANLSGVQNQHVAGVNRQVQREIQAVNNVMRMREQEARAAQRAAADKQQAFQRELQAFQNTQRMKERALQQERAAQAAVVRETQQLAAAYNPVMAAAAVYTQRVEQLNRAHQLGVLTSNQLQSELARTAAAYTAIGQDVGRASAFVNNFNAANTFASRGMNSTGMAFQQTGYQVGDFLVQIQGGTNAFVAFGQQATQLVGILPMFGSVLGVSGTALIGLSAGLGIAIPLATAAAAAFMRAGDQAEKAREAYSELGATLDRLERVDLKNVGQTLAAGALAAAGAWHNVLDLITRVETKTLGDILKAEFDLVLVELERFQYRANIAGRLGNQTPTFDFMGLDTFEQGIQLARVLRDVEGETREELQASLLLAEARLRNQGLLTSEVESLVARLAEELGVVDSIVESAEAQVESSRRLNAALAERSRAYATQQQEGNAILDQLMSEIALQETILRFGEDSARAENRRAVQARQAFMARLNELGVTGQLRDRIEDAYDEMVRVTGEAEAAARNIANGAVEAARLTANLQQAASALSALARATLSEGIRTVGLQARTAALRSGQDVVGANLAGNLAERRAALAPELGSPEGAIRAAAQQQLEAYAAAARAATVAQREFDAALEASREDTKGDGGGTARERATLEAVVATMTKRIAQERELMGLSGQARREREIAFEIEQKLADSKESFSAQQIAAAARQIAAAEEVNNALRRQAEVVEQIGKVMESSMTDGFMSIVDGTKTAGEAFRDMARMVVAELFKVLVVQQLVGQFSSGGGGILGMVAGGLGFANGGAFSGGNVMPFANGAVLANMNRAPGANVIPFATGGVVGSPTTFPMSGGRTGLMGEAGPEAIMPLKRGRDGKLGVASQSMSLNVTVTMDPSTGALGAFVRNEAGQVVASAAPQIVDASKAAIIDSRRRGGAMRITFR